MIMISIFNVKYLGPYHGEDLETMLFMFLKILFLKKIGTKQVLYIVLFFLVKILKI